MRIEKLCGKNGNEKTKNPYFYNNFTMALKMGEPTLDPFVGVISNKFMKNKSVQFVGENTNKGRKIKVFKGGFVGENTNKGRVTPAENLSPQVESEMKAMSEKIFRVMNCRGLGRVDYLIRGEEVFFMEINTIPGLSPASIYPQQLNHYGFSLEQAFGIMIENSYKF
jgi:hypothetical protein